jgi:hypothetical protein
MIQPTANVSFAIQIITGLMQLGGLTITLEEKDYILKQLLFLEMVVQIIEGIFYAWLIKSFNDIENITKFRYYDWFFSTPLMLISLIIYLIYARRENEKTEEKLDLFNLIKQNKKILIQILVLNALMLLFGYLNEIGILDKTTAVILGFIPFFIMFKLIYDNFAKYSPEGLRLFKYFVVVWGLYGIAALTYYDIKNASYNILDLFSKNALGIYYSYIVFTKMKK